MIECNEHGGNSNIFQIDKKKEKEGERDRERERKESEANQQDKFEQIQIDREIHFIPR